MINDLINLLSYENIYLIANWGVIPFWMLLVFFPYRTITHFFVQSILVPSILSALYLFIAYQIYLEGNIFDSFELYSGLDGLYSMFSSEAFLLIFWIHFLAISLFLGSWITRDSIKYMVPRFLLVISLLLTYFTGPVGLVFYWLLRIFFAKKISFND